MKKNVVEYLKAKHPLLASELILVRQFPSAWKKHRGSSARDWTTLEVKMGKDASLYDLATAFFLRVAMEHRYETIIEIGTYSGERIITLKRLLQEVEAWGLDIGPDYSEDRERAGVKFRRFETGFFDRAFPKPLVLSQGTLSYFAKDEMLDFLKVLERGGFDLALAEPSPLYVPNVITRRSPGSFYYPYERILLDLGFYMAEPWSTSSREKTMYSRTMIETRVLLHAQARPKGR
jgi:hypothetical protein